MARGAETVQINPQNNSIVYFELEGSNNGPATLDQGVNSPGVPVFSVVPTPPFGPLSPLASEMNIRSFPFVEDSIDANRLLVGGETLPGDTSTIRNLSLSDTTPVANAVLAESFDGGQTFSNLAGNLVTYGFAERAITSIAIATFQGTFAADANFPLVVDKGANTYDPDTIYVTGGTSIFVTKNDGTSWAMRSLPGGSLPNGAVITSLVVDPRNRDTIYATSNAFGANQVFVSTTAGRSWAGIGGGLPQVPVWKLVVDPRNGNLYAGTDDGVWDLPSGPNGTTGAGPWVQFGVGMPDVAVHDLQLNQNLNTLTAGTYGRGVYQLSLPDPATIATGALRAISGAAVWTGPVILDGNTTIAAGGSQQLLNGVSTAKLTIVGPISDAIPGGNFTLTKQGLGDIILAGTNTYGGITDVAQGNLVVDNPQALGAAGTPDIQTVTVTGNTGTFELEFINSAGNSQATVPIAWNAPAAQVAADLDALSNIGGAAADVNVTLGMDSSGDEVYTISFLGSLNGFPQSQMLAAGFGGLLNPTVAKVQNGSGGTIIRNGAALVLQTSLDLEPVQVNGIGVLPPFNGHATGAFRNESAQNQFTGTLILNANATVGVDSGGELVIGGSTYTLTFATPGLQPTVVAVDVTATGAATLTGTNPSVQVTQTSPGALPNINGVDTIAFGGSITGGTFELQVTFNNLGNLVTLTTPPIVYPPSTDPNRQADLAANIMAALNSLTPPTVAAGASSSTETLTFPALAQPTMTASGAGLTGSVPTVSVTPPVGGQSTITFGGAITGGTFTLTVDGLTTSAIFWSPNQSTLVANIQAALNALTGQLVGNQVAFQGAATVTDAGNNFGLTKEGTGTLVLGSANTYTGNTIINQGAVNVQNNTGLGNGAETQVLYGAQLQLQGGITVGQNELLRISGTGAAGSGALENISGANFWEGNVILAQDLYVLLQANGQPTTNPQLTSPTAAIASSAPTVAIGALPGGPDDKLTIDGVISDSGLTSPLAIVDANPPAPGTTALDNTTSPAVVVFTNSNTYDGGTTVSIGSILRIQNGKSLGTGNTSVQVGGTLQVDGDPAGTGNSISVPANITLAGAGVNVLGTQTLTVTGPLTNGQIPPAPSSYTLTLPAYTLSGALVPASATANPILLTATAAQVQAALAALPSLTAVGGTVAVTQSTNLQNETVYTIMFQGATGEPLNLPLLMPVAIPGVSVTASYVSAGALENISGNNTWSGSVTLGVANPDFVAGVTITNGGSGYSASAPPTVTFSGGGGSGATGTAVVNAAGQVVAVNLTPVTGGGTLYTSAPTVTFSGGGGSGAAGNAFLQGDFIGVDLQPGSTAQTQLTITGAIADPTSPTGPPFADLTKVGQGILVFPNKNNYHGNTFITGGDLNIQNSQALGTSTQEVQAVTEVGPASGTFSITFNGYTTPSIPENATAAQVQAALDALPSIAGVGAFVLVSETNAGPAGNMYQFAFFGPLDGYAEPQVSVSGTPGMIVTSAIVTAGDGATFVYPGASLQLQGNINVGSTPLTLYGGSGYGGNGALENVENTNTWSNIIVLGGNASIGVTDKTFQNDVLHITQPIVDISENSSFGVTKVGPGTLDYQAQNLYTGLTQVNAGTLLLDNSSGAPSLSGNLAIGSGVAGPSAIAQWRDSNQLTPAPQVLSTSPTTYTVTFQLPGAQNALTANTSNLTGTNTNVPPAARTVPGSFPSTDEVQTITFSPTITGGTFTLTYVNPITSQSQTTLPITWSANPATLAANIATALNVLLGPIVTVNGGGVMDLNGKTETVGTLNIVDGEATTDASGATGTGMLTAGSLNMVSGIFDVQNGGQLVLDGNVTATSDVNNSPTVSAVITGPGTVSLNGLTRTFTTVDPSGNNGSGAPLVTVGSVANTYTVAFQSPGPVTMSANPSGLTGPAPTLNVTTTATGALPATDALETITFGGTITGGTFTLTVNGSTTAPIAWNATAATLAANIQAALNALASATQPVDLDVQSAIIGTGSEGLIKAGNGTMEVDNINPYTGGTQINAGDLQVDGTIGNVVLDGGSLSGSGFVGNVVSTAVSPALDTINPGDNTSPATDTGILTANNVTLGAQSVLWVDLLLGNQVPGAGFYDQLVVNGNTGINLGNATLTGTSALNINVGDSFVIIQIPQTASGTITGTFANPNNTVFLSGAKFKITYSPTVNPTEVILTKESANVSLSVAAVPTTSVFGQPVTITATFTPEAGASASLAGDPVNFVFDDGTPNANTVQGSIGANNQAILNTNGLAVGSHTVYVTFPGDSSYNPVSSQSSPTPFTVNQSTSKVTVTQDVASPVYGQTVDITATITGQFNYVNTINVSNGGSGYSPATQVTISGGGGSGATATATISGGQIVAITVTNPGSGYASTPTVTISDSGGGTGAAATAVLAAGATGTATFTINGTPFAGGPVTLDSNGQAQIPLSTVNAGAAQIKVSYSGDGNFKPSSSTYTLSIQKDGSTAQGSSTPSSTNFGQPVTLTATLSANAPGSGTPTGSVTFYDGPVANNIVLGTGTLSSGTATISTSTLTPGNHTITLAYNGDSNFKVTTGTFSYTVSKNGSVTTLLSPVPVSPVSGQPVTFTATVAAQPPASGKPTGTVTFLVNGNPLTPAATLSSADQATFTDSSLTAGSYTITAMYNSDSNFATSTSSPLNLNVGVAASKTTVTASQTTAVFGQALNITATVSAVSPGTGTPVGTADFFVDGSPVATGVPVVNGQAVLNTSTLQLPIPVSSTPHTITVNFNDSDTFFSNSSGTLTGGLTVNQATPTVGVTSLPNPSVFGQDVTFTITVGAASPGSGTPGGNVDVVIDGTAVASALPLVNGQTTFDTSSLTVGTHRVVINFHDTDGNFTSGSGLLTGGQVVTKASATASIFSSGNPSVFGQPVTFTANLNTVSGTPTGFVTFIVDGQAQAPAVAVNGGQANLVLSNLPPGMHQVSAAYAGDTNFNPVSTDMPVQVSGNGTSETVTFQGPGVQAQMSAVSSLTGTNPTVAVATTTPGALPSTAAVQTITFGGTITGGTFTLTEGTATTAAINWDPSAVNLTTNIQSALNALALTQTVNQAATTTALSASANPSGFGQPVTFTAAVTGNSPSQGVPTSGQVMFSIDNGAIQQMVTVNSQGKANFTISSLAQGTPHTVVATFLGNVDYAASAASNTLTQTILQSSITTVASSLNPSTYGQSVTFTATVAPGAGASGTPTGTVTFSLDNVAQAPQNLNGGTTVTFTPPTLAAGPHTVLATYNGGGGFAGSSAGLTETVKQDGTNTSLSETPSPSATFGQAVTFTASVTAAAPGSGTPTGTATFTIDGVQTPETLTNGVATFSASSLNAVTHTVSVAYGGDTNFSASNSGAAANYVVNKSGTTTTLNATPSSPAFGQTVTFTATVAASGSGSGTPTGSVTFVLDNISSQTTTVSLNSSGQATVSYAALTAGNHSVTATYVPGANFLTSPSATASVTVGKANTNVSLSENPTSTVFGQALTLTANVANTSTFAIPTGTVQFSIDSGAQVLSATLNASGQATVAISSLSAATHTIVANYQGTTTFAANSSTQASYTVSAASTKTTVSASPNPATPGQAVTFTAAVLAQTPGSGTPAGQVTFFVDGSPVQTVNVSNGKATFSTSSLGTGTHAITASYNDNVDSNYLGSSSSNSVSEKIASNSKTTLKSSKTSPTQGQTVKFTATVTSPGATGSVTFFVDGVNMGTFSLNGSGQAIFSTASLKVGKHTIKAVYSGDSTYNSSNASVSVTVFHVVGRRL